MTTLASLPEKVPEPPSVPQVVVAPLAQQLGQLSSAGDLSGDEAVPVLKNGAARLTTVADIAWQGAEKALRSMAMGNAAGGGGKRMRLPEGTPAELQDGDEVVVFRGGQLVRIAPFDGGGAVAGPIEFSGVGPTENDAPGTEWGQLAVANSDAVWTFAFDGGANVGGRVAVTSGGAVKAGLVNTDRETTPTLNPVFVADNGEGLRVYNSVALAVANVAVEPPTNIHLSSTVVRAQSDIGTVIANITASDPDAGETFTFTLLDDDGGKVSISGANLLVADEILYTLGATVEIEIRATDAQGNIYDKTFSLAVTQYPGTPLLALSPADAASYGYRVIPSEGQVPSGNRFQLVSPLSPVLNGAVTRNYTTDPQGDQLAHRFTTAGNGGVKFATAPIGSGSWTLKVAAKSNAGGGSITLKLGDLDNQTGAVSLAVTEAGWTSATYTVDTAAVQKVLGIFVGAGVATDVAFANIQIYPSGETIPDYADEGAQYLNLVGKTALGPDSLFTLNGNSFEAPFTGRVQLTRNGADAVTFTEGTFMYALKQTSLSDPAENSTAFLNEDGSSGFFELSLGAVANELWWRVREQAPNALPDAYNLVDEDFLVIGARLTPTAITFYLDEIPIETKTGTFAPITMTLLNLGGSGYGDNSEFYGYIGPTAIWDTALSDADYAQAATSVKQRIRQYGGTAGLKNYLVATGDSITAGAGATNSETSYLATACKSFSPNLKYKNYATSGWALGQMVTQLPTVVAQIEAANFDGRRIIAHVLVGANGIPAMSDLQDYWTALRDAGAMVVACTMLSTDTKTAGAISTFNDAIRAASAYYDALADFAAEPLLGGSTAYANTTYFGDGTHPTQAGHTLMASITAPVIAGLML
jgi:lysophospholipase L1-like esterase